MAAIKTNQGFESNLCIRNDKSCLFFRLAQIETCFSEQARGSIL